MQENIRYLQCLQTGEHAMQIQRQCPKQSETKLVYNAKSFPKLYYNYAQSEEPTRVAVGCVVDTQGEISTDTK